MMTLSPSYTPTTQINPTAQPTLPKDHASQIIELFSTTIASTSYEQNSHVLHKYISDLSVSEEGSKIYVILAKRTNSNIDAYNLAKETLLLVSSLVKTNNWEINHIELLYPSVVNWEYRYYLHGVDVIKNINNDTTEVEKQLKFEYSTSQNGLTIPLNGPTKSIQPTLTIFPTKTFQPTSEVSGYKECKTFSSGYVTCRIQKAYCSYQPSVNGQPTYCNDAPYPDHSFTYLVWGQDVSYLNGHCLLVKGEISYYNGKPQITWNNNSGFVGYCD